MCCRLTTDQGCGQVENFAYYCRQADISRSRHSVRNLESTVILRKDTSECPPILPLRQDTLDHPLIKERLKMVLQSDADHHEKYYIFWK